MSDYTEASDRITHPRYTGLPTFMRAPYREDFTNVDIGLIGVPFDGGVTNRPGARHGPREVRNQSSLIRKIRMVMSLLVVTFKLWSKANKKRLNALSKQKSQINH